MKFLLTAINAKFIHSNPAVYSLRAYAGAEWEDHIELAEYTINQPFADILADVYKRKPDVIGFSCYIWNISLVLELVAELHKLLPRVPIWLGGPEVSFDAPKLLEKYPFVTGIMIGEGEETFRELLGYYVETSLELRINNSVVGTCGGQALKITTEPGNYVDRECHGMEQHGSRVSDLRHIPGLCLREGYTVPREPMDMNRLPFLYRDLDAFENKIIYYESSRGCPFRCSYCLSSIDKQVRLRDLEIVKKELQFFLDHQVKQVKFVDRTFNCNHRHAMEIWQYILEHDNGDTNFHFEVSADLLRGEEIRLLGQMRPGLVQLEIGVQSTCPETIHAINRTMDIGRLEHNVRSINTGHNVHLHLDLIAGLPYEDYETFAKSFNQIYALEPEQLQLGFLKVLKGSPMHEKATEYGICYMDKPPYEVLYTRWLSYEEVLKLKGIEEMVELYYNSNQFRHTLAFLVKQFASPFSMFEQLARFYERRGYFTNSPARAYRYQVLLEFALEWRENKCENRLEYRGESLSENDRENSWDNNSPSISGWNVAEKETAEAIYKELLTYDMYLRENLKSRPEFAKDLKPYKDVSRRIYIQEEQERKLLPGYEDYDHKQLAKMTHLEPFRYPVWDRELWQMLADRKLSQENDSCRNIPQVENGSGRLVQRGDFDETYILFDYRERDPLTGEVRTVRMKNQETK